MRIREMRVLRTFESYESDKIWIIDKYRWDKVRKKLDVSVEGELWSKDIDGKLNSFWYKDRGEGWVRKSPEKVKTFESHFDDLSKQIAIDLLPKLKKIKSEKGIFTVGMFDNYMEERKGNLSLADDVMSHLVDMGFDFDGDIDDEDIDDIDLYNYNIN